MAGPQRHAGAAVSEETEPKVPATGGSDEPTGTARAAAFAVQPRPGGRGDCASPRSHRSVVPDDAKLGAPGGEVMQAKVKHRARHADVRLDRARRRPAPALFDFGR